MPAPTNTTAATAQVLTTWGDYTVTDVNLLSAPSELWFTYTTGDNEYVFGLKAQAPVASTYDPIFRVYDGTVMALNQIFAATAPNRAGDIPCQPNTQYWIKVTQATGGIPNADLTLRLVRAASGIIPVGSLLIPDVSSGFRMAAISAVTGEILGYVPFPAGESGVVLADGTLAMENAGSNNVAIYPDPLSSPVASVAIDLNGGGQISSNDAEDAFFVARANGVSPASVTRVNASGVSGTTWTMPLNGIKGAAVSPDESIIYWIQNTGVNNQPVRRFDTVGNAPLSDLAAGIANTAFGRGVIVLHDGSILIVYRPTTGSQFVIRYSAAGAVLNTYTRSAPAVRTVDRVTKDLTAGQFWLWEQSDTNHFLTLIRASDGVELRVLPPVPVTVDGEIQETADDAPIFGASWSCPLMVSRQSFVIEPPGTNPPTTDPPFCECLPPTAPPPPPGNPPGAPPPTNPPNPPRLEPTIGEQQVCDGGGTVPEAEAPENSEEWWGHPEKNPVRWMEFYLVPVAGETVTYRWASRPYAGEVFIEGRVTLDGWLDITRSASSMTGEYSVDSGSVLLNDADGLIRELLDDVNTQWFLNREAAFFLLSQEAFRLGLEPRLLFGGRCNDVQPADDRKAQLSFEDILAPYLDRTYPQHTLGDAYPWNFSDQPVVDEDLNTEDPGLHIPDRYRDQVQSTYYGPFVDTKPNPETGVPDKGMVPVWFMGYTYLTAGTGEVGEPTPEMANLMSGYLTGAGWGGWGELYVGKGTYRIPNVYASDLHPTNPKRILMSEDRYGVELHVAGHAGYTFATRYVIRNGFLSTVIHVRGPILWDHITGRCLITVDLCGWEDENEVPIDQSGPGLQSFLTQHVLANDGDGFRGGPQVGLPTFANGRPKFWTDKIQEFQATRAAQMGTEKGPLISMALTKPTTLREVLAKWCQTNFGWTAKAAWGGFYVFTLDADGGAGIPIRERIELKNLPPPKIDWPALKNWIEYTIGWDPEQNAPRTITLKIHDQPSIDALDGDIRKWEGLGLDYTADDLTGNDSAARWLMLLKKAPRWQPLPVRTDGVDRYIGERVDITHRDGFGQRGVGYDERQMVTFKHVHRGDDVTLEALDIGSLLIEAQEAVMADNGMGEGEATMDFVMVT